MNEHEYYMKKALQLALQGEGRTSPNPMVGCVIVNNGEIVGQSWHQKCGEPHAEVNALLEAGTRAQGADLYVTLEPCCHYGKTPPCTKSIIDSGVRRVFAAMPDPNSKVSGRGFQQLKENGIEVQTDILLHEALLLNEVFCKYITTGLPFLAVKTASSLDGKIADYAGSSRWISSEKAREYSHMLRHRYAAVMAGAGTVTIDNPLLTCRHPDYFNHAAPRMRIIIDPLTLTDPDSKCYQDQDKYPTLLVTKLQANNKRLSSFIRRGINIFQCPANENSLDLKILMQYLGEQGIDSILSEGGGELNFSLAAAGLIDKIYSFIAPIVIGGRTSPGSFSGAGFDLDRAVRLVNMNMEKIGPDYLLTGYAEKGV